MLCRTLCGPVNGTIGLTIGIVVVMTSGLSGRCHAQRKASLGWPVRRLLAQEAVDELHACAGCRTVSIRAVRHGLSMSDETFTLCPYCREVVEPDGPGVTYAVELKQLDTFGGSEWVEGMGGYFHPGCSSDALGWKAKLRP